MFFKKREVDLSWIEDYKKTFNFNGIISLAWWVGTSCAVRTRKEYGYWPILELAGKDASGKTEMIKFLWRCIGVENYEGMCPTRSSEAEISRTLSTVLNTPVVLLDCDNSNSRTVWDNEELKTLYNGHLNQVIVKDIDGHDIFQAIFRGGIMLSQQHKLNYSNISPAVNSRIVRLYHTKDHFTKDSEKIALKLHRMTVKQLEPLKFKILKERDELFAEFKKEFEAISEKQKSVSPEVERRLINNHSMIVAWVKVLPMLFGEQFISEWSDKIEKHFSSLHAQLNRQAIEVKKEEEETSSK